MHRGQQRLAWTFEASLRSRSPGVSLEGSLRSPGGQPRPCPSSVLGPAKVVKGCFALGRLI